MDAAAQASFREFVAPRQRALLRSAYVLCGDRHRAEDLVQGALARTAAKWSSVRDGAPEAYVRRAMYHEQVSRWRRAGVLTETSVASPPDRAVPDPGDAVDLKLALRAALDRLAPRQRAVLALRFYEDLPEREIADLLGISVGTVRSTTSRALERLRRLVPAGTVRWARSPGSAGGTATTWSSGCPAVSTCSTRTAGWCRTRGGPARDPTARCR